MNNSLQRLQTDYLDILLLHRPDPFMDAAATGQALDALVNSGKVRAIGVSNFKHWDWDLLQSCMQQRLITNQIEISLLQQAPFTDGTLAQLQRLKALPMAWSPLAGGQLFSQAATNQTLTSLLQQLAIQHECNIEHIAIAWLLAHPANILPIIGTNNLERLQTAHQAFKVNMDRETWFELWTAASGKEVA